MDKIIDRQNRAAGTYEALEEQEKRARVEVTLRYDELKRVGLRTHSTIWRPSTLRNCRGGISDSTCRPSRQILDKKLTSEPDGKLGGIGRDGTLSRLPET